MRGVDAPGSEPLVFDMGTGPPLLGRKSLPANQPFHGTALVTHLHWDHVQGLLFFSPILRPGWHLDVYVSAGGWHRSPGVQRLRRPALLPGAHRRPPRRRLLPGDGRSPFGPVGARFVLALVPHVGDSNGYRVEIDGRVIVYISDHQEPADGSRTVATRVVELCATPTC